MSVARQNSRIDADHTANTKLYNDRPTNAMVTYSLRRVCGGRTTTLVPQTVRRPYGFYANRTATLRFSARRKVIASLAVFLT